MCWHSQGGGIFQHSKVLLIFSPPLVHSFHGVAMWCFCEGNQGFARSHSPRCVWASRRLCLKVVVVKSRYTSSWSRNRYPVLLVSWISPIFVLATNLCTSLTTIPYLHCLMSIAQHHLQESSHIHHWALFRQHIKAHSNSEITPFSDQCKCTEAVATSDYPSR